MSYLLNRLEKGSGVITVLRCYYICGHNTNKTFSPASDINSNSPKLTYFCADSTCICTPTCKCEPKILEKFVTNKNELIQHDIPYLLDQMLWLLFILFINLCGFYLRVATIQERHLFCSANPFADVEESEVAQNGYQTDKKTYWLLLIGLLRCFDLASLIHDEFSRVHVLLKYLSCLLWLLFESGV